MFNVSFCKLAKNAKSAIILKLLTCMNEFLYGYTMNLEPFIKYASILFYKRMIDSATVNK